MEYRMRVLKKKKKKNKKIKQSHLGIYVKTTKTPTGDGNHTFIHFSTINKSQDLETSQVPPDRKWMQMWHIYTVES